LERSFRHQAKNSLDLARCVSSVKPDGNVASE
jgi:hypothetical protein